MPTVNMKQIFEVPLLILQQCGQSGSTHLRQESSMQNMFDPKLIDAAGSLLGSPQMWATNDRTGSRRHPHKRHGVGLSGGTHRSSSSATARLGSPTTHR